MKSRPKKPSNPHPSSCTRPVKWPKIRPVIERDSISLLLDKNCKLMIILALFFNQLFLYQGHFKCLNYHLGLLPSTTCNLFTTILPGMM